MIPELRRYEGEFRHETKFVISARDAFSLEHALGRHPAGFSTAFPRRRITNLYLDTHSRRSQHDSLQGVPERFKARIRWYGASMGAVEKPILELKFKRSKLGAKLRFPLRPFSLGTDFSFERIRSEFRGLGCSETLRESLLAVEPALMNSYTRSYYRSLDRAFMFTVDSDLDSAVLSPSGRIASASPRDHSSLVVELKFDDRFHGSSGEILRYFPFRPSRNSKYVRGLAARG